MDAEHNPLRHIPDTSTRHLILQLLAWMWCIIFASAIGSWYFLGLSAIPILLLAGVVITATTFESTASNTITNGAVRPVDGIQYSVRRDIC